MRMTDTPFDCAMQRSKQELARQLVDANAEIERLKERCEAYKGQVRAGAVEIERLKSERDDLERENEILLGRNNELIGDLHHDR